LGFHNPSSICSARTVSTETTVGALTDSLFTGVKGPDCVTGEEGLAVGQ
jgi:hypothetical protein